jgi:hypothetical protein
MRRVTDAATNRLTSPANVAKLARECDGGLQCARDSYLAALQEDPLRNLPPACYVYWFHNHALLEPLQQHYTERGFSVEGHACPMEQAYLVIKW